MKLFVAAVLLVLAASGCRKTTNPPVAGEVSLADSADQIIFDGRFFVTQSGVNRGEMRADTIFVFNDQSVFVLRKVSGAFTTATGAPNGTIRGDRGTYDRRLRILNGYGNVVVTSTNGERLTSNHLRYSEMKDEISSDSAFTIVRGGDVQRGVRFVSDPNLKDFRCLSACSGSATVPLGNINP
ncbi:MAG TPA: LPS export ABC transporter periplasmic protein LptC [Gemmatimonadaceae bacterium]|nr:LPS export ABC transporter periplasmic protein LptC [Gemmatimonadaceae bacterium]